MQLPALVLKLLQPFVAKKIEEIIDENQPKRPSPEQVTSQIGKVGLGASVVGLTQVESPEAIVSMIAVLLVNLFFIYYPAK